MNPTIQAVQQHRTALQSSRAERKQNLDDILAAAQRSGQELKASDTRKFDAIVAEIRTIDAELRDTDLRVQELEVAEQREGIAAAARVTAGVTGEQRWSVGSEASTYHRGPGSPSFFKDLRNAQRGDYNAAERLQRNNRETGFEARAIGNTGAAGGSGGEFAPPLWITDEFVALARPGRITANLCHREPLPTGVSSVNMPKVSTGTTVANQTTQNSTLSQTDITTASLSSTIVTIGGKEVVSQQLLDQAGTPFDQVILRDLAADYARQINTQVLSGSGSAGQLDGILTAAASSPSAQTWTQATPTAAGFYGRLALLQATINAARFQAPDTLVLHPRRWAWFASAVDGAGRPLVTPTSTSGAYNAIASSEGSIEAGKVGSVLGMDVYSDPLIPTNGGSGANQDTALMFIRDDVWLWESDLRAETFVDTYADSMAILYRTYGYSALIANRYPASLGTVTGSGMVSPTFAS